MSYYDVYDYERERPLDDRDPYSAASTTYERGMKRPRSPSPYDHYRSGSYEREDPFRAAGYDAKRARSRDDYERDWNAVGPEGPYSPERSRRSWHDLDPEEKEREWQRYEREREWDRYYSRTGGGESDEGRYRQGDQHRSGYGRAHEESADEGRHGIGGGGFARSKIRLDDPMDSPTILTFKRFTQLLRDQGKEPAAMASGPEATQALFDKYQEYRKRFHRRAMEQFWQTHKDEQWFQEKYAISDADVQARMTRRKTGRKGKKKTWLSELRSGALDNVCWDAETQQHQSSNGHEQAAGGGRTTLVTKTRLGETETIDDSDSFSLPSEPNQILIRSIPVDIGRADIEEALQDEPGFRYLALGEPHPMKRFARIGYAVFEPTSAEDLLRTAERLGQKIVAHQKLAFEVTTRPAQAKLRLAPDYASTLPRLLHDLRQARRLVALFERDDIEELFKADDQSEDLLTNAADEIQERAFAAVTEGKDEKEEELLRTWLASQSTGAEDAHAQKSEAADAVAQNDNGSEVSLGLRKELIRKMLDMHIDLLRQVYSCDYYSSTLCDFPEELARRAPKSLRRAHDGAIGDANLAEKAKLWASNVDEKHRLLMRPDDNEIGDLGGTDVHKMLLEAAAPYSREDEAEKHRCIVKVNEEECGKPFKAQIFVQKHVLNKHREWFLSLMADKIAEARYYNNYVRDPQRPMPPMQAERNAKDVAGNNGHAPPLVSRLGGYNYTVTGGAAPPVSQGYYGAGSLLRMGGSVPVGAVRGNGNLRDWSDDPSSGVLRLGPTTTTVPSGRPTAPRDPLPMNPQPLDPRAAMAPKSYQDLDAGVPSGTAEIELEY